MVTWGGDKNEQTCLQPERSVQNAERSVQSNSVVTSNFYGVWAGPHAPATPVTRVRHKLFGNDLDAGLSNKTIPVLQIYITSMSKRVLDWLVTQTSYLVIGIQEHHLRGHKYYKLVIFCENATMLLALRPE